jgi:hypothetical protein
MFTRTDSRKTMMNVMLAIALLAVAIPMCQMIGCEMGMCGGMMPFHHHGTTLGNPCGGTWVGSASQVGILPTNIFSALIALIAAIGLMAFVMPMMRESRQLVVIEANSPPDPIPPRGERFRV